MLKDLGELHSILGLQVRRVEKLGRSTSPKSTSSTLSWNHSDDEELSRAGERERGRDRERECRDLICRLSPFEFRPSIRTQIHSVRLSSLYPIRRKNILTYKDGIWILYAKYNLFSPLFSFNLDPP